MNFNLINLLLVSLCLNSCGVKSDVVPPNGTERPRIEDEFYKSTDAVKKEEDEKAKTKSN